MRTKRVGSFVPALVREAFKRRGFNNVDIVLRWREIVGPELADQTWPVRIEWPRRQEGALRADGTAEPGQRTRLVVGAAPARALDVEYAKRDIVERVNRYLGYRAATELTATPDYSVPPETARPARGASVPSKAAPPTKQAMQATAQANSQGDPAADPLKAALARLGEGVARRGFSASSGNADR
jgi:hypothetical protein